MIMAGAALDRQVESDQKHTAQKSDTPVRGR